MTFKKQIIVASLFFLCAPWSFLYAANGSVGVTQNAGVVGPITIPVTGGSGDKIAPSISKISIVSTSDTITISWRTDKFTLSTVKWGLNDDYGLGSLSIQHYDYDHQVEISNLQSATRYYFDIIATDQWGNVSSYEDSFVTQKSADTTPPQNVFGFVGTPQGDRILLQWKNPPDLDFQNVRIVRSDKFIPFDPQNGKVIYEGSAENFVDTDVNPGTVYAYTIFAKDKTGNYSSGSVALVLIPWFSEYEEGTKQSDAGNGGSPTIDFQIPDSNNQEPAQFTIPEFEVNQKGSVISPTKNVYFVDANLPFLVYISSDKLPENARWLVVTVKNIEHQAADTTFLFTYDPQTKRFYAQIPQLYFAGNYVLHVSVLDSGKKKIGEFDITVTVKNFQGRAVNSTHPAKWCTFSMKLVADFLLYLSLFLFLLLLLLFAKRRRKDKKDKVK